MQGEAWGTPMTASLTTVTLLSLMRFKGIGRKRALRIVDAPAEETDFEHRWALLLLRAAQTCGIGFSTAELRAAWRETERELKRYGADGVQALSYHDAEYPRRLRNIPDPPAVLFVKGETGGLDTERAVAVVGTRHPTAHGERAARESARTAVDAGFAVVSGLALGCDTAAHEGCLDAQGTGVAVLAHGLDMVHPPGNAGLAERLLGNGCCLVSEYPAGARPVRASFAERDRIQSGLSDAVLVVETEIDGGTMHTARFARDQGRPLACVTPRDGPMAEGNRDLLEGGGATPVPDDAALRRFLDGAGSAALRGALEGPGGDADQPQMSLPL